MKKYKVNVNGVLYEITLEVVEGDAPAAAAPLKETSSSPASAASAAPAAGGQVIAAPMPGTILWVQVANGASVKKNDVLFVLEAMKMENEILAPRDGIVAGIAVSKGANVSSGDVLCSLQ